MNGRPPMMAVCDSRVVYLTPVGNRRSVARVRAYSDPTGDRPHVILVSRTPEDRTADHARWAATLAEAMLPVLAFDPACTLWAVEGPALMTATAFAFRRAGDRSLRARQTPVVLGLVRLERLVGLPLCSAAAT